MFLKSKFSRVLSVFCLTLIMSVFAFGDTIRLKDGSIIKGKIVSFGGGRFTILIGDGARRRQLNYLVSEVESISFDTDSATATVKTVPSNDNSTIITVGRNNPPKTSPPAQTAQPKVNTVPPVTIDVANTKPIEISVSVVATPFYLEKLRQPDGTFIETKRNNNGWTNSGWVVKKGQKIRITGSGRISLGGGRYATPGGIASLSDASKLMPQQATGGLIAVIGDNNNDFIFVGDSLEFTAIKDGALFLGINEGNLDDNSGAFDIKIQISPEIGY